MKLKEFDFNSLKNPFRPVNLAVREDLGNGSFGPYYEGLSIGETLRMLPPEFAEMTIADQRWFFDTFVIEVSRET